jgi:hypothetical protein
MSNTVCDLHGGATKCQDGSWLCCAQEELAVFPTEAPASRFNPPPADFRERVEAAKEGHGNG